MGGCDIVMEMHKSGDLESLLVKEKIIEGTPAPEESNGSNNQSKE